MLTVLLSLCVLAAQGGQAKKAVPSAEEVASAQLTLDEAFRSGELKSIQAALEAAQTVPHPAVVRGMLRGLGDERAEVKLGVLQALRWLDHRDALEALHRAAKNRELMKPPELALAVLRGIGQHAQPSSIAVLAHDPFQPEDSGCLRARIFGLARIRTRDALEALFDILATTVGGAGQRRIQGRVLEDVRLALMLLTGLDQGLSPELWEQWWRENRKTFQIPRETPLLAKELRREWDAFWGLPTVYEREGRREDRGQDTPRKE